ncbi:MAG TPA: hypothetical protein VHL05_05250 [Terriglobales bacterium]|jgi:hypothetical protein|nr:hypothetical protein [Terriglobales bacterium]
MSARNGDKSRFHRQRKQKIARRKRTFDLLEREKLPHKSAAPRTSVTPKAVSA